MARAPKRSADEWRTIVERFRESDLSCEAFAAQEKIKVRRLQWWGSQFHKRGTFARKPPAARPSTVSFLPVRPTTQTPQAAPRAAAPLEIVAPSGLVVRVQPDFDAGALARLLAVLGGSS